MFNKIVAMLVMACALLMGAQSATAQDLVEVELVAAYGDTTSKLYEPYGIPAKDRKSAAWWERTLVNGKPITDVNFIRAGDKLTLVVPKDGLANVATPETLTAGIEESNTGVLKGAEPNTQSVTTTDESVIESTKPQAEQPASKQTPDIFLGNPLESGLRPATELPNFVPVNREAEERQAANNASTVHTVVAVVLGVVALIVSFHMFGSLSGSGPKLPKTKLKVVDSKKELEKKSRKFYAQSAQASRARKPATDLTAPIKRFAANGGRIATDFGKKASLFLVRPGMKAQKAKGEKWAGRSEPVVGPKMKLFAQQTAYTPPAELAKANVSWDPDLLAQPTDIDPQVSPIFEEEKQEDLVVQAKESDVVQATDWMARINAHRNTALVAQEPEKVPGAKWYVPPGIAKFRACKVRLAIKGMFSKTGTDTPFVLWFREQPDGHLEWFNPVAEAQDKESAWARATPRTIEGLIGRNFELQERLGIELNDNAIKQANDKSPGRILVGNGFSLEDVWKQMPPGDGVIVPMRDPTKDAVGA